MKKKFMKLPVNKQYYKIGVPALIIFLLLTYIVLSGWSRRNVYKRPEHPLRSVNKLLFQCTTPFDTLLGYAYDIPAFSNCHRGWIAQQRAYSTLGFPHDVRKEPHQSNMRRYMHTGNCWTALEYVSRFYYFYRGMTLYFPRDDMDVFWLNLQFFGGAHGEREYSVMNLPNYEEVKTLKDRKRFLPRFADVIVWAPQSENHLKEGHLAVVVGVEKEKDNEKHKEMERDNEKREERFLVFVAEQNFDNRPWEGRNFSRVLRFHWRNGEEAVIEDPLGFSILGRVRPGKVKPMEEEETDL